MGAASKSPRKGYLVKGVPRAGYRVFRLEFTRRHIVFALLAMLVTVGGIAAYYIGTLSHAEAKVGELRNLTQDQHERLQQIDAKASQLDAELRALEQQNEQIRKMIGDGNAKRNPPSGAAGTASKDHRQSMGGAKSSVRSDNFAAVAEHIATLRQASSRVRGEGDRLRSVALRVLNMKRLEDIARARVLAAIPSINPAGAAGIASAFGWRAVPFPEFHEGVDLDADYGDAVRAAAAGTIVSAGWDGGYGIKVDIDHGNGYHTWYCHLSRADVEPGQYVTKAQTIASVGSTGESTGPHLHYQIMLEGKAIDPTPYLTGVPDKVLAQLK